MSLRSLFLSKKFRECRIRAPSADMGSCNLFIARKSLVPVRGVSLAGGDPLVEITPPSMRGRSRGSLPAELPPRLLKQRIGATVVELQLAASVDSAVITKSWMLLMMFLVSVLSWQSLEKFVMNKLDG